MTPRDDTNPTGVHPDTGEEVELPVDQFDDPGAVEVTQATPTSDP